VREVISVIEKAGATPAGVLVALDREEIGTRARIPATEQMEAEIGIPIRSLICLTDLVDHLEESKDYGEHLAAVKAYRHRYGTALDG
jgi:orotate phosphoribosyltransferase